MDRVLIFSTALIPPGFNGCIHVETCSPDKLRDMIAYWRSSGNYLLVSYCGHKATADYLGVSFCRETFDSFLRVGDKIVGIRPKVRLDKPHEIHDINDENFEGFIIIVKEVKKDE